LLYHIHYPILAVVQLATGIGKFPGTQVRLGLDLLVTQPLVQRKRAHVVHWFNTHIKLSIPGARGYALDGVNKFVYARPVVL
jgi:hypothetical protein